MVLFVYVFCMHSSSRNMTISFDKNYVHPGNYLRMFKRLGHVYNIHLINKDLIKYINSTHLILYQV